MTADTNHRSGSSKTIGSLVQGIVSSLHPEDGPTDASPTRPSASVITTPAAVLHERIGQPRGGSGFSAVTESSRPTPVAVLRDPARWMPTTLRGSLAKTYNDRSSLEYGWDGELTGYELLRRVGPEARLEGIRILSATLEPGPQKPIVRQLRYLRDLVIGAEKDAQSTQIATLSTVLAAKFPAAAVELAIEDWKDTQKYWPSYAELLPLIEARLAPTQWLLALLNSDEHTARLISGTSR